MKNDFIPNREEIGNMQSSKYFALLSEWQQLLTEPFPLGRPDLMYDSTPEEFPQVRDLTSLLDSSF